MKFSTPFSAALFISLILLPGCSTVSKITSGFSNIGKSNSLANNPEQMRVCADGAVFQPISRVEVPQFQGLQTPLVAGRQRFSITQKKITLAHFTPVKVLSRNARFALVELSTGQRGFVAREAVAKESAILAEARTATRVTSYSGPTPLPAMDFSDLPVDQAMLNNIDNIPLPEAETPSSGAGFQTVDGVLVRKPDAAPTTVEVIVPEAMPVPPPEATPEPPPEPLATPALP